MPRRKIWKFFSIFFRHSSKQYYLNFKNTCINCMPGISIHYVSNLLILHRCISVVRMDIKCQSSALARKSCLCRRVRKESTLGRTSQLKTFMLWCQALSRKLLARDNCVLSSAKRDNRKAVINSKECPHYEETDRKKPKVFCETIVKISRLIAKQVEKFWRSIWSWGKSAPF